MRMGRSKAVRLSRRERRVLTRLVTDLAEDRPDLARRLAPEPPLSTRLLGALAICAGVDGALHHGLLTQMADDEGQQDAGSRHDDTTLARPPEPTMEVEK